MTIEKYGVVIVSDNKVVVTSFVFSDKADKEKALRWAIDRLETELLNLHFKIVEGKR
jgi:hypothetical protein